MIFPRAFGLGGSFGLVGAQAATRFVGGTTTGSPTLGTFALGDFVIAGDGKIWICTAAGSPGTWVSASTGLTSRTVILTGTTTYTVPAGTRAILVECVGGGGAGGGAATAAVSAAAGAGGAGGCYAAKFVLAPKLTAFTVAVGAASLGGANTGGNGAAGNDTSFDTGPNLALAKAGAGGAGDTGGTTPIFITGGQSGLTSGCIGDVVLRASAGGLGNRVSGTVAASGFGGMAAGIGGGGGPPLMNASAGGSGGQYGGGGGGACVVNGSAAAQGGNGAAGVIVVWEFA